jgi:hypothetical protein
MRAMIHRLGPPRSHEKLSPKEAWGRVPRSRLASLAIAALVGIAAGAGCGSNTVIYEPAPNSNDGGPSGGGSGSSSSSGSSQGGGSGASSSGTSGGNSGSASGSSSGSSTSSGATSGDSGSTSGSGTSSGSSSGSSSSGSNAGVPGCGCEGTSNCAIWPNVYVSFYGYNDNSCTTENIHGCNDIASPAIHQIATQGTGTYDDPSTCAASDPSDPGHSYATFNGVTLMPGTIVYLPEVQQYFVMEDSCLECGDEYACQLSPDDTDDPQPPSGCQPGQNLHIDFWLGPNDAILQGQAATDLQSCEDNLTVGGPYMGVGDVIVNPPKDLPVSPSLLFSSTSSAGGTCWNGTTSQLNAVTCQ